MAYDVSLTRNNYYGPLLYSYIEAILGCGEMLEDDFQAVLSVYEPEHFCTKNKVYMPYGLFACTSTLLPSVIVAKKIGSAFYVVPSVVMITGFACYSLFQRKRRKHHEELMTRLIRNLKNIQELNKRIYKYLKERRTHSKEPTKDFFRPYSKIVINFIEGLSKKHIDFYKSIISHIFKLAEFCDPLKEDCKLLKEYRLHLLAECIQEDLDNCLKYTNDVINVQQLITSKILSYIAIITCWEECNLNKDSLDNLLDYQVPSVSKLLIRHHNTVMEMFNELRRTVIKYSERKLDNKPVVKEKIPKKLRHALDTSVNNLCFVLEKLYNIMDIIEKSEDKVDRTKIDKGLIELRSHAADTFEALDILCKLYGILSEPKTQVVRAKSNPKLTPNEKSEKDQGELLNERDSIEDKERYELYLKANEVVENCLPVYEEASDTYLRLVIKELKQNLYQHQLYVSAKERWKDERDEDQSENSSLLNSSHIVVDQDRLSNKRSSLTENSSTDELSSLPSTSALADDTSTSLFTKDTSQNLDKIFFLPNKEFTESKTCLPENETFKVDTLTREVKDEEQDAWNPILQSLRTFSQNKQFLEETFGENSDSD